MTHYVTLCKRITNSYHAKVYPYLLIQGFWLKDLGFNVGDRVSIDLVDDALVIKKVGTWIDKK
ncbi:MAG: hypothetical protein J1F31_00445 [Erysipelotrichales bacterium]|nr:hypothetical protein [Erysipelotrichales bacterium]